MSDANTALLADSPTLERLRALFTALETNQVHVDAFKSHLLLLGFVETLESARLLRGDRTTFTAFCTALRRGAPVEEKTHGAPSLLVQRLSEPCASPSRLPVRRDLMDTGSTSLLHPYADTNVHVTGSAELRDRAVARAILTRLDAGELTVQDAAGELDGAGFSHPELARALQLYASSGRVDFTKALAAFTGDSGGARWIGTAGTQVSATEISLPASASGLRSAGIASAGDVISWSGVGAGVSGDDRAAQRAGSGVGVFTNLRQSPLKSALFRHSPSKSSP